MTRKEALAELIAKVEAGTLIPDHLVVSPEVSEMIDMAVNVSDLHGDAWADLCGAYDGSLDAALALHQAVLPGWAWTVQDNSENRLWPPNDTQAYWDQDGVLVVGNGMPPARAWLLAILKALHEMEDRT